MGITTNAASKSSGAIVSPSRAGSLVFGMVSRHRNGGTNQEGGNISVRRYEKWRPRVYSLRPPLLNSRLT